MVHVLTKEMIININKNRAPTLFGEEPPAPKAEHDYEGQLIWRKQKNSSATALCTPAVASVQYCNSAGSIIGWRCRRNRSVHRPPVIPPEPSVGAAPDVGHPVPSVCIPASSFAGSNSCAKSRSISSRWAAPMSIKFQLIPSIS